jgi:hypothetical protein
MVRKECFNRIFGETEILSNQFILVVGCQKDKIKLPFLKDKYIHK